MVNNAINLIIFLFLFAISANAQHDHGSHGGHNDEHTHKVKPPHGGELKDIGKYHLEIVFEKMNSKDQFKIYLLKSSMKQLNWDEATATIKLIYKDGKESTVAFKNQLEYMSASLTDVVNAFEAEISVSYKGKTYKTSYVYKGLK